ncbi:hypothetical protein K438DRAFT_440839 [Mycena galopus ATCC 62051]|nr:hypothetical protein K438DRAFT_440839 [Mycena galopus ATCC 62051]
MVSTLAEDRARLADIDAEISLLQSSLSALRKQRAQVQKRLDARRYPVLTLPTEITSEIFLHTLPVYPDYPPLLGLDSPTLLAQICRSWREIAVGTPELWGTISFDYSELPFAQRLYLCQIWLARSRSYPLIIRCGSFADSYGTQVLDVIIPHRARWECLDIAPFSSDLAIIEGPMPALRRLDLTVHDNLYNVVTFSPAPLLRSVTLRATTPLKIAFPMGQLTSLRLHLAVRHEYVAILQQTCNLVYCQLGIVFDGGSDLLEHAIDLPCLESLSLFMMNSVTPMPRYLDDFIAPALTNLRLEESILEPDPIERLTSFISKSGCKLQEVCVTERTLMSTASYREAFPSIPQFSFDDDSDSESISTESSESLQ